MIRSKVFKVIDLKDQKKSQEVWEWVHISKREMGLYRFEEKNRYLVSLGERPNSGYQIEVIKVDEKSDKILVEAEELVPLPGGFYPQVLSYPYFVADVEKSLEVKLSIKWPDPSIFYLK